MKFFSKIGMLFFMITLTSCAQKNTFSDDVVSYLNSNGTSAQYEFAYDELLKMMDSQYPQTESNTKGWDYLNANKEKHVAEIIALLVPVYQKNFTKDEISKMAGFYTSDTGKQLINDRSKMTDSQKVELDQFYKTGVGKKILEKQPILSKDIAAVSEGWSRDLYETALSLLK